MSGSHPDMIRDAATAVAKAAPPLTIYALTLNEWLAIASIFYILVQLAYLLWKWAKEARVREVTPPEADTED